jgi:cobalt-zinc-cadmium efflux system outer membrane protein
LQTWATTQRLDLEVTHEALKSAQQQLDHVRHWRWLGGAEVGIEREHDKGGAVATGPAAALEFPVFNQGGGAIMRAHAQVEILAANLANMELMTHNNIAAQLGAVSHAQQVVEQYQHSLLPLHQQVMSLSQQRYNYMLIGTPELLLAKQQALNVRQAYIEAVRDYWLSYVELLRIAGGKLPTTLSPSTQFVDVTNDEIKTTDEHQPDVHTARHEGTTRE